MNGLAVVSMIGWFVLCYLAMAGSMFILFFITERRKLGCGEKMSLYELLQVAQSLVEKPVLFAFLMPFIWFVGLWIQKDER